MRHAGLLILVFASSLYALDPTPWDAMGAQRFAAVKVTTQDGKTVRATGLVTFSPSEVSFGGQVLARSSVKEIEIREARVFTGRDYYESVRLPGSALEAADEEPIFLVALPFAVGMAVVGPIVGAVKDFITLVKPPKLLFRVVP